MMMSDAVMPSGSDSQSVSFPQLNVLILYDHRSTFTNMVREHLESFSLYSDHCISYAAATISNFDPPTMVDLTLFDVLIIHYSVRLCLNQLLPVYARAVEHFGGLRVLFIQDEYDNTEIERQWIARLGIDIVFTCVPQRFIHHVYPPDKFPKVEFINVLTGYVPLHFEDFVPKPLSQRKYVIGYRGRPPLSRYGDLGLEKSLIGQRMREACDERGIPVSIEWENDKRIYGPAWYQFLQDCRATLGTESGSNVFDEDGRIQRTVDRALANDPSLTYQALYAKYVAQHESRIRMNQVSPRIFEAIALRTALVLFEGEYSGIIKPDIHYIPLRKDFSNVDDVLSRLVDDEYLEKMIGQAYADIIESRDYTYQRFVEMVFQVISRRAHTVKDSGLPPCEIVRHHQPSQKGQRATHVNLSILPPMFTWEPLSPDTINPELSIRHIAKLLWTRNFSTARGYIGNALLRYPTAHRLAGMIMQGFWRFHPWHRNVL